MSKNKSIDKSAWAGLMRRIIELELFELEVGGSATSERVPVRCIYREHEDRRPSAAILFYDNGFTGFRCQGCGRQCSVLEIGVVTKFGKTPGEVAEKLRKHGLSVPDSLTNDPPSFSGLRCLASVEPTKTKWLMKNYVPDGALCVIQGDGGIGKSTVVLDLIARASTGRKMPDGTKPFNEPVSSIIIAAEDPDGVLVKRLDAAGADKSRIHVWDGEFALPDSLGKLKDLIVEAGVKIVYIDALFSVFASNLDPNKDEQVRAALDPLRDIANETGTTVLVTRHVKKSEAATASFKGMGSVGISNVARSVLSLAKHPRDDCYLISVAKQNYGSTPASLKYRISNRTIDVKDGEDSIGVIEWLGTDLTTADEAAAGQVSLRERAKREIIKTISSAEHFNKKEISKLAHCSPDTIDRAIEALEADGYRFRVRKNGYGTGSGWVVSVVERPDTDEPSAA